MKKEWLLEMLKTPSVSGYEQVLQKKVMAYMEGISDRIHTDMTGNVISILNEDKEMKVLLCGHIDEIGFLITNITHDGMVKVTKCGGIRPVLYLGTQVQIMTKQGVVPGVVATTSSIEKNSQVMASDLCIDIGVTSKEEALQYVAIGDPVCAATSSVELFNQRISGRGLDDRVGAFIVMEATRLAKEKGCKQGVYCATTVGEETSMRGAYHASNYVKPSCAIIIDVTYASDYPGVDGNSTGEVQLEGGPVLCKSSLVNDQLNKRLMDIAKRLDIPYQWEVAPGRTSTDGDVVHLSNGGVPIALISIPLRYMHSSVETASYKDIEMIIQLLAQFLCELEDDFCFDPFKA